MSKLVTADHSFPSPLCSKVVVYVMDTILPTLPLQSLKQLNWLTWLLICIRNHSGGDSLALGTVSLSTSLPTPHPHPSTHHSWDLDPRPRQDFSAYNRRRKMIKFEMLANEPTLLGWTWPDPDLTTWLNLTWPKLTWLHLTLLEI